MKKTKSSVFGTVPLLTVVAIQLLLRSVSSTNLTNEYLHHECINHQGKYKMGSIYEKNLNQLVHSISTNAIFPDGSIHLAKDDAPNFVSIDVTCRGDSYLSKCHSCFTIAISGLRKRCPENKGAMIWYDQCLIRMSAVDSYGKMDYQYIYYLSNPNKVSGNPELFNKKTSVFLETLAKKATRKDNVVDNMMVLYAAGEKRIGTNKVYAMVQCSKDLVFQNCYECLDRIIRKYPECCNGKRGGRVLSPSCSFRYEFYPFLRT